MSEFFSIFSSPEGKALLLALIPVVASVLAAILPDGHPVMKVVNAVALNVGKAKNDPNVQ